MSSNKSSSSGIGICGVLTIVFVVLKLVGVINWSWLWVLCPLWIDILLTVIVLVIIAIIDNKNKKENMEEWENKMVDLIMYQRDCVDAFRMEFSKEDIKCNSEVKRNLLNLLIVKEEKLTKLIKCEEAF